MSEVEKYSEKYPKRNVAVVGLRDEAGNVLLVRTHKLTEWWQPVGGGVDPEDKTPQIAAAREAKEELGVEVKPENLTLVMETPYDFGEGTVWFYEWRVDRDKTKFKFDTAEIIDHQWFSPEEAQYLQAFPATKAYLQTLI